MTDKKTPLPGPNILLMGPAGTGKTHAIGTLVDAGIKVRYLAIESGLESLLGYFTDVRPDNPVPRPIPPNLAWHKITAPRASFKDLAKRANDLTTKSYEVLGKIVDPNRSKYNLLELINESCFSFVDDRTGEVFPPADEWGPDCALVVDGLTGLSKAAMEAMVGGKPIKNPGDYGIAQDQIEAFLRLLCDFCPCWFVLIAHVEKEVDQIQGGMRTTVSTLGKALPPKIPAMFSDVILTVREGKVWSWSTATVNVETKARSLPWAENIPPDFRPVAEVWRTRVEAALAQTEAPSSTPESSN